MRVRAALLSMSILLSLTAGCGGGITTGQATTPPGGDDDDGTTGGDDDDDGTSGDNDDDGGTGGGGGGGGGNGPAQETTIPSTIGGTIGIQRLRSNTGTDDLEGAAWFLPQPLSTAGAAMQGLFHYYDDVALDSCINVSPDNSQMSMQGKDAGDAIAFAGNGGTLSLGKLDFFGALFYMGSTGANAYQPNATYTLSAPGGADVGAFSVSLEGPGDITVTSPDLWNPLPVLLDNDQPLSLSWTSVPDGRPVFVWITQEEEIQAPFAPGRILLCRFADDGQGTVPAEWMGWFADSPDSAWDGKISVIKYRWWTFSVSGGPPILATIESRWDAIAEFN